jgi:hypothetical protein
MLDVRGLLQKHRGRGVFVDANLLVLLLVGRVNPSRIYTFKRTSDFVAGDFELLESLVAWFGHPLFATPHILSQLSDLTDLSGYERTVIRDLLKTTIEDIEETYEPAKALVNHPAFKRLGLADASIVKVSERNVLVLTSDLNLQHALSSSGLDAINFNHVRALRRPFIV